MSASSQWQDYTPPAAQAGGWEDYKEPSAASPISPPPLAKPNVPMRPSFLIGDPNKDATPQSFGDVAKGVGRSIYQVSTPGIATSFLKEKAPGIARHLPDAMTENAAPVKKLPSQIAETGAMMILPELAEGAPEAEAGRGLGPAVERPQPRGPSPAPEPGRLGRIGEVAARRASKIPGVQAVKDIDYIVRGKSEPITTAKPAPEPIPETNGIPWGSGGQGPLGLRGQRIPFKDPGAPLPEHPGVFPGAPLPEAPPPEVGMAHGLRTGAQAAAEPAKGLGEIPVKGEPAPIARPAKTMPKGVVSKKLQTGLSEGLGAPKPTPVEVPEGYTPVKSSAVKSFKYDSEAKELHVQTKDGSIEVRAEVTPAQVKDFENSPSKGKVWKAIRDNNVRVAKIINGKRQPMKPTNFRSVGPDTPIPDDLTDILSKSLERARAARIARPPR